MARLKGTSQIIGFGGYAFAGKDASADILVDLGWKKTYMSKPLHEALRRLDPLIYIDPMCTASQMQELQGIRHLKILSPGRFHWL